VHLRDTEEEAAFRAELRAWLAESSPPAARARRERLARRRAHEATGSGCCSRPATPASTGPSRVAARAPARASTSSTSRSSRQRSPGGQHRLRRPDARRAHLIAEGTPEQKAHHLRGILTGEHVWCQGFSEPEAAATSPACAPRRSATATTTSSPAKDLDLQRVGGRLLRAARPAPTPTHRSTRASPGSSCDGPPRHRSAPARHRPRLGRVRRAVPRRGPHPRREPGRRRERRLARRNVTLSFERGTGFVGEISTPPT